MKKPTPALYESFEVLSMEMAREKLQIEEEMKKQKEMNKIKENLENSSISVTSEKEESKEEKKSEANMMSEEKGKAEPPQTKRKKSSDSTSSRPQEPKEKGTKAEKPEETKESQGEKVSKADAENNSLTENPTMEITIRPYEREESDVEIVENNRPRNKNLTRNINPFYERTLKRNKQKNLTIELMRKKFADKEMKNYYNVPIINAKSHSIMANKTQSYIPISERAIELQNQKNAMIMINEQKKLNKELSAIPKIREKKMTKEELTKFIDSQFQWKENIEIKRKQKQLLNKVKAEEEFEKNNKYVVYKNRSKSNNAKTLKRSKTENHFDKLYNDAEESSLKLALLQKKYAYSFKPEINIMRKTKKDNTRRLIQSKSLCNFGFEQKKITSKSILKKPDLSSQRKFRDHALERQKSANIFNTTRTVGKIAINPKPSAAESEKSLFSSPPQRKISSPDHNFSPLDQKDESDSPIHALPNSIPVMVSLPNKESSRRETTENRKSIPDAHNKVNSSFFNSGAFGGNPVSQNAKVNSFFGQNNDTSINNSIVNQVENKNIKEERTKQLINLSPVLNLKSETSSKEESDESNVKPKTKNSINSIDEDGFNDLANIGSDKGSRVYGKITDLSEHSGGKKIARDLKLSPIQVQGEPSWVNELQNLSSSGNIVSENGIHNLYMINTRNGSSNGVHMPITVLPSKGLFDNFFRK